MQKLTFKIESLLSKVDRYYINLPEIIREADGAAVKALVFHVKVPGSIPGMEPSVCLIRHELILSTFFVKRKFMHKF